MPFYLSGVDSIFSEMCCDQSAVKETPGCSSEITENHTIICLSLINEKINELTLQAFLPSKVVPVDVLLLYKEYFLSCQPERWPFSVSA